MPQKSKTALGRIEFVPGKPKKTRQGNGRGSLPKKSKKKYRGQGR